MATLRIGSAAALFHLPPRLAMSGLAARTARSTGEGDPPPRASAVAFENIVLVFLDVVAVDQPLADAIRRDARIQDHQVRVLATHTHAGPCVMQRGLGKLDPAARDLVAAAGAKAARRAVRDRMPCHLDWAKPSVPGLAHDRRRGVISEDASLKAVRWRDPDGEVRGMLVTYPCHPTSAGPQNLLTSGDYPAYIRQALETSDALCHFATGCAGDINTGHSAHSAFRLESPDSERSLATSSSIGVALADAVRTARWHQVDLTDGVRLRTAPLRLRLTPRGPSRHQLRERWETELQTADPGLAEVLRCWIDWSTSEIADQPGEWMGEVSWLGIGELGVFLLPGEPFLVAEHQLQQFTAGPTMVFAYAEDCPGYFPSLDQYELGGYEVDEAHRYYGMPAPFAPGSLEQIIAVAAELPHLSDGHVPAHAGSPTTTPGE